MRFAFLGLGLLISLNFGRATKSIVEIPFIERGGDVDFSPPKPG